MMHRFSTSNSYTSVFIFQRLVLAWFGVPRGFVRLSALIPAWLLSQLTQTQHLLYSAPLRLFRQVSLPKGKGVKLTILEEKAAKIKKAQNN